MTGLHFNTNISQDNWNLSPKGENLQASNVSGNSEDAKKLNAAVGNSKKLDASGNPEDSKNAEKTTNSKEECQTCKERKYKDGSDEHDVSFKAAAHVSPEAAGAAVRAHENQHVQNAYEKAAKDNGEVLSATVTIKNGRCPECGRTYVAGGTTRTMIKYTDESNPYQQNQKSKDASVFAGENINTSV